MTDIDKTGESVAKGFGDNVLWVETDIADWDSQANMFEKGCSY